MQEEEEGEEGGEGEEGDQEGEGAAGDEEDGECSVGVHCRSVLFVVLVPEYAVSQRALNRTVHPRQAADTQMDMSYRGQL